MRWVGVGLDWARRGESVKCPIGEGTKKWKREQRGERREEWKVGPTLYVDATSALNGPFNTV